MNEEKFRKRSRLLIKISGMLSIMLGGLIISVRMGEILMFIIPVIIVGLLISYLIIKALCVKENTEIIDKKDFPDIAYVQLDVDKPVSIKDLNLKDNTEVVLEVNDDYNGKDNFEDYFKY